MDLKRMRQRAQAWRLARRGDVLLGVQEFWDGIFYLARDLIPEDEREISRDLFGLIAYAWGVAAPKPHTYDPFDILRIVRDRAWLGYADTPALIQQVRRDLPRATVAGRMADYFAELAAKHSTYLFLPIVARIDRHQLGLLSRRLALDDTMAEYGSSRQASMVRQMFLTAPRLARERDLFFHAMFTACWGSGMAERAIGQQEFASMTGRQLRLLYERPDQALAAVRADAATHPPAARSVEILSEIGVERNRPLLLEALFLAESMAVGPQYFTHAFEIEERFI